MVKVYLILLKNQNRKRKWIRIMKIQSSFLHFKSIVDKKLKIRRTQMYILLMGKFINMRFYIPYCKTHGRDLNFRLKNQIRWAYTTTSEFLVTSFEKASKKLLKSFIVRCCIKLIMKDKVIYFKNLVLQIEKWTHQAIESRRARYMMLKLQVVL